MPLSGKSYSGSFAARALNLFRAADAKNVKPALGNIFDTTPTVDLVVREPQARSNAWHESDESRLLTTPVWCAPLGPATSRPIDAKTYMFDAISNSCM